MGRLSVSECFNDAPLFRTRLTFHESAVRTLERKTDRLLALLERHAQLLDETVAVGNEIAETVEEWSAEFMDETGRHTRASLQRISSVLSEVEEHRRMHAAQERALLTALRGVAEQDASGLRRSQRAVEKLRQERDASMERFFQCKQGDTAAMSASANVMFGSRKALHRSLCVYVNELNRVQVNRRAVVLSKLYDHASSKSTFFKLGGNALRAAEPLLADLYRISQDAASAAAQQQREDEAELQRVVAEADALRNEQLVSFQTRDLSGGPKSPRLADSGPAPTAPAGGMRGWLYMSERKPAGNAAATATSAGAGSSTVSGGLVLHPGYWSKMYVMLVDSLLYAQSDDPTDVPAPVANLLLCTVKPAPDVDRNFVFTVISPARTLLLQAESSADMLEWIAALQGAIASALQAQEADAASQGRSTSAVRSRSHSAVSRLAIDESASGSLVSDEEETTARTLEKLRALPSNAQCADCGAPDPEWASINLGILLCIECSGIHRSLGVHISQVRSLDLDRWRPEWVQALAAGGNAAARERFESNVPPGTARPGPTADRAAREAWIRAKYIDLAFAAPEERARRPPVPIPRIVLPQPTEPSSGESSSGETLDQLTSIRRRSASMNSGSRLVRMMRSIQAPGKAGRVDKAGEM